MPQFTHARVSDTADALTLVSLVSPADPSLAEVCFFVCQWPSVTRERGALGDLDQVRASMLRCFLEHATYHPGSLDTEITCRNGRAGVWLTMGTLGAASTRTMGLPVNVQWHSDDDPASV